MAHRNSVRQVRSVRATPESPVGDSAAIATDGMLTNPQAGALLSVVVGGLLMV